MNTPVASLPAKPARTLAERVQHRITMLRVEADLPSNGYTFGQQASAARCRELADDLERDLREALASPAPSAGVGVSVLPLEAATDAGLTCDDLLGDWIPGSVTPAESGTYLRQFDDDEFDSGETEALSSWNGIDQWNTGEAADFFAPASPEQQRPWRGVCPRKLIAALQHPAAPSVSPAVEGADLDAAAVKAGHITWCSMQQCADAWLAVNNLLHELVPGWSNNSLTGREAALETIRHLVARRLATPEQPGSAVQGEAATMHLRYDLMTAGIDCKESRHAEVVMRELGITYQHATPQSIADQWWFWNCKNVPEQLPKYLSVLTVAPENAIGYGLSREDAERIIQGATPPPAPAAEQDKLCQCGEPERGGHAVWCPQRTQPEARGVEGMYELEDAWLERANELDDMGDADGCILLGDCAREIRQLADSLATPNPVRAEQQECGAIGSQGCTYRPEGPRGEMQCTYCGAEQPEGKGVVGEVYALPTGEHRVELGKAYRDLPVGTKVYASAPAATGAAVGVDEADIRWLLNEVRYGPLDHDYVKDEKRCGRCKRLAKIAAALAGKDGAE